jgi:hypothetical protein
LIGTYEQYFQYSIGCRGTGMMRKSSGKIEGPDFPFSQTPEYFCVWQVQVSKENKIRISITYKSAQENLPCFKHYLQIFDGPFPINQSLARICLDTASDDLTSTGSELYVMLWIDSGLDEKERPIFSANYEEVTPGIILHVGFSNIQYFVNTLYAQ